MPVTTTNRAEVPTTVLGQQVDAAHAAGALQVRSQSQRGVYFRYPGSTVAIYMPPGGYKSQVAAWTPPSGFRAGWHCATGTSKYVATGWKYPSSTCPVVVDWVAR